jgi:hypothetical protein
MEGGGKREGELLCINLFYWGARRPANKLRFGDGGKIKYYLALSGILRFFLTIVLSTREKK